MTDNGSVLFPSITICRDEMFSVYTDLIKSLQSGELEVGQARDWFESSTSSRSELVRMLSVRTVEASNDYPCNTVSGLRAGEPCSFPFKYPDCQMTPSSLECRKDPTAAPVEYNSCPLTAKDSGPWCFTRTHPNRSIVTRQFGYCSTDCSALSHR